MQTKDWNFDRAFTVLSMMHHVQDDLLRTAYNGSPSKGVIDRMAQMLRDCADDIEKMRAD